jgi:hypothetical protein
VRHEASSLLHQLEESSRDRASVGARRAFLRDRLERRREAFGGRRELTIGGVGDSSDCVANRAHVERLGVMEPLQRIRLELHEQPYPVDGGVEPHDGAIQRGCQEDQRQRDGNRQHADGRHRNRQY